MRSVRPKGQVSKLSNPLTASKRAANIDRAAAISRASTSVVKSVIEGLEQRTLFSTFYVTNGQDEDAGGNAIAGSLRYAIGEANATPGSTIDFSQLPAATPIVLSASLATVPITGTGTFIDGTTATGGRVIINGKTFDGFDVTGSTVTIQGLWLKNMGTAMLLDGSSDDLIQNNYIGDVTNTGTGANGDGIVLDDGSAFDTIGGTDAAQENVISGNLNTTNTAAGITLQDTQQIGTYGNTIEGNFIGVTPAGNAAAPNNYGVILGDAFGNVIQSNVISGNTKDGIFATDPASSGEEYANSITGNIIGMDSTASNPVPNGAGMFLDGGDISGDNTITLNTVEDNTGVGIEVAEGEPPVSAGYNGDYIANNTIADNGDTGIVVDTTAESNTISQNNIYGNGKTAGQKYNLGIDLGGDGVTQNTATSGTTSTGANGLTPFPVLGAITVDQTDSTMLTVPFTLQANPSTAYTVEIFANTPAYVSPSGYGQGQFYISSVSVTTDANGAANGSFNIAATTYAGDSISATATNVGTYDATLNPAANSTSEFSANQLAPGVAEPMLTIASASGSVGSSIVFPIKLSAASTSVTTFTYTFTPGTAPLSDITGTTGTVTIQPGSTTATILVPVVGDSTGGTETFTVTLSNLSTNVLFSNLQATESATGTILAASSGTTATTTTLTATPNTAAAGAQIALAATVAGTGFGTPTGTVTFLNGTTVLGTGTVNGSGVATLDVTTLPVGSDTITAVYSGDTNYSASTSAPVTVTITGTTQKTSTTTLVATPTTGGLGATITLTATVTGLGGTPTGTVTFSYNGTNIGTQPLNGNGKAVLTTTTLPVGTDAITATYSGSGSFVTSTSTPVNVTITSTGTATSTTTLTASPTSAPLGSTITLTATVASSPTGGFTPTGTVSFMYGGNSIGTAVLNNAGQAILTIATLPVGSDSITASYPGDSNYATSVSTATVVTITAPLITTTTTLTASGNTVAFGNPVTLTATLAHTSGSALPTGTVTFVENGVSLGTASVGTNGKATLTLTTLTAGSNSIRANYGGDTNYLYSTSPLLTVLVTSTANTTLTISTNPVIVTGTNVLLSTTVTSATAGGATPRGTVSFYQRGTVLLGTVQLQSDGTASLTTSALDLGSDPITAVYGGEPAYPSSTSPTVNMTVLSAPNDGATVTTTVTVTTVVGNTVVVTTTVTPTVKGGTTPTGTVSFYTNGVLLGTAAVQSNGNAVLTTTALQVGTNNITAVYSGNTIYTPSQPAAASAFVNTLGLIPSITKSTLPSALIAGTLTHGMVTVTLTNVTDALIREPQTTIHLYASTNGTLDANSVLVQQWFESVKLKAGKTATYKFKVKNLPATMATGTYTLMIRVSNTQGDFGYFFAGPTVAVTAARIGLSASVSPVKLPATLVSGDNNGGSVQFVLSNTGNFTSTGPITIELTASGTPGVLGTVIKTVTEKLTIAPGSSRTVTIPLGMLPTLVAGSYHFVAQLTDPLGVTSIVTSPLAVSIATSFS